MHKDGQDDSLGGDKVSLVVIDLEEFSPWMMVLLLFRRYPKLFKYLEVVPFLPAILVNLSVDSLFFLFHFYQLSW